MKHESGQTIIEVLVALSTAVVIVGAATLTVITALRNSQNTQIKNTATRYSQEGIEYMRYLRDSNYSLFSGLTAGTTYCLDKGANFVYPATETNACGVLSCGNNLEVYSRSIKIERNEQASDCAPAAPSPPNPTPINTSSKVTVTVSWTDSTCENACPCHDSKLIGCLSDYTIAPTPADVVTPTP